MGIWERQITYVGGDAEQRGSGRDDAEAAADDEDRVGASAPPGPQRRGGGPGTRRIGGAVLHRLLGESNRE
jgi:hypothetical protein